MKISLIAAISENKVIGRDNALPWHISEDLKRFKAITKGHPVIMGRKTYESIGRLLPNRTNIIITRDKDYKVNEAITVSSIESAIEEAKKVDQEEIFIIGGGQIFEQVIEIADKLYLTIVHTSIDGDVYFPDYSEFTEEIYKKDSSNENFTYTFLDLEK
ncbi:MAG TPA: dihydrofolate reductase [Candidatus Levybacteria bacterium]|nr:dihydrofolate reductase [Candidatus Levybacteria bacterium]